MFEKPLRSDNSLISLDELLGDEHVSYGSETPLRADAFLLSDEEKINIISRKFHDILHTLGMDLDDESLKGTPRRIAKMYVNETFKGLNPANRPQPTLFSNTYRYNQMLVERNILVQSTCEHHFVPILGKAHVAYISAGNVIGLSKLNRIVDYYSRRPQVQERLTIQIAEELKEVLQTRDVAVIIDAEHLCVQARGIKDPHSSTVTSSFHGKFLNESTRQELMRYISMD
ncbi:MAG: GTP cyclohydrolase I FolE [Bacteroidota bacterium]